MCLDGELALVVASEDVESDTGDEVVLGIEGDVVRSFTLAFVCDAAVERVLGRRLCAVNGDFELEVDGQGQTNDVEAGANVGARARRLDDKFLHCSDSSIFIAYVSC